MTVSVLTLARSLLSVVPGQESSLVVIQGNLIRYRAETAECVRSFAFDHYYNWGLRIEDTSIEANYFLEAYSTQQTAEFCRRLEALDIDGLRFFLKEYCRVRYNATPSSLFVFGGYLYGVTEQVTDLDLLVILDAGSVIEKDIAVDCTFMSDFVNYDRRPERKIGLTVISRSQIHAIAENNSVLRSAVIAGTTAIRLWGEPFQTQPVPSAILVYHAAELMTWGFKAFFEDDPRSHRRSLWRTVEAAYIVNYLFRLIEDETASPPRVLSLIKEISGELSRSVEFDLADFLAGVEQLRLLIFILKNKVRSKALRVLINQ
jgi:hypothetical protein